jgi:hypothetical protein
MNEDARPLKASDGALSLRVSDDGIGFDPTCSDGIKYHALSSPVTGAFDATLMS